MSDIHDNYDNLDKAINVANKKKCSYLLFAGDFVSPPGLSVLNKFNGKVEMVWGNNEGNKHGFFAKINKMDNVSMHNEFYEGEIDKIKIFMNHFPRLSEIAANTNEFDLCIYGHVHDYRLEKINDTVLICPGNIVGWSEKPSFVIFDTTDKSTKHEFIS